VPLIYIKIIVSVTEVLIFLPYCTSSGEVGVGLLVVVLKCTDFEMC